MAESLNNIRFRSEETKKGICQVGARKKMASRNVILTLKRVLEAPPVRRKEKTANRRADAIANSRIGGPSRKGGLLGAKTLGWGGDPGTEDCKK